MVERTARERAQYAASFWTMDETATPRDLVDAIERAIQAAILDEREACARVADQYADEQGVPNNREVGARDVAARIRARGEGNG